MTKIYRIEHILSEHGMWKHDNGITLLQDPLRRLHDMPMPNSDIYRANNKEWFCGTVSMSQLLRWFEKSEIKCLLENNFQLMEYNILEDDILILEDDSIIFTKDNIISCCNMKNLKF